MTDWKAAEPGGVQDPSKALDEASWAIWSGPPR